VAWISDGKNFNTQNFHSMCMGQQDQNLKESQSSKIFQLESCRYEYGTN
jgi:hypothetical protein